jgi:hypothetical protein
VDTHVSRSAQQAKDKEKKMSDIYGLTSYEPLASYDPDTHFWKMFAVISLWGLTECLETLPKSGMTRSGKLFQQQVSARLIDETESFAWPTPRVTGSGEDITKIQERFRNGLQYKQRLEEAVALYPTMSASGMGNTGSRQILQRRVKSGEMTETELKAMSAGNGGRLNPTWVEWLMGFPFGWTDLED